MFRQAAGAVIAAILMFCTGCSEAPASTPQTPASGDGSPNETAKIALPFKEDSLYDLMLEAGEITEKILGTEWGRAPVREQGYSTRPVSPPKCSGKSALTSAGIQEYFNNDFLYLTSGEAIGPGRYWTILMIGTQAPATAQAELLEEADNCQTFTYTREVEKQFYGEEYEEVYSFEIANLSPEFPSYSWSGDHIVQQMDDDYECLDRSIYGGCLFDSKEAGRSANFFSENYGLHLQITSRFTFERSGDEAYPSIPFSAGQLKALEEELLELIGKY